MATKAKSITAAELTKLTRAAVKASTGGVVGSFVGKGPTMGYLLRQDLAASKQLELAEQISKNVAVTAKASGVAGIRPKPVVVIRPGKIIAGYWPAELNITIR
jgi:hypothetical protein